MIENFLDAIYSGKSLVEFTEYSRGYLSEIREHDLAPQIFQRIKQMNKLTELSTTFCDELEHLYQKAIGQNLLIKYHTDQILCAFNQNRVPVIPLKGVVFAERFFGHSTARATSDVDLFVHEQDIHKAIQCLRSMGFRGPEEFNPIHFHCVMWRQIQPGFPPLCVEVHWSLLHSNTVQCVNWNEFWTHSEPLASYQYVRQLSVQHTFYAICLHGANHKLDSFKHMLDVAHLIFTCGNEIDYIELMKLCEKHQTERRVKAVLNLTYAHFPSLKKLKPLPHKSLVGAYLNRWVLRSAVLSADAWNTRLQLVRQWLWPLRSVALWYMRQDKKATDSNVYLRFYRQRILKFVRSFGNR